MNTTVSTSVNIKFYGEEETVWKYSAGDILKSNGVLASIHYSFQSFTFTEGFKHFFENVNFSRIFAGNSQKSPVIAMTV